MDNYKYKVTGMSCVACASSIEKKLNSVDGVDKASVNLVNEELNIAYDANKINYQRLRKEVKALGYDITTDQKEKKTNNHSVILAMIFAIPVFYLALTHMFKQAQLPLPMAIHHQSNAFNFALTQMGFTILVIFFAKDLFVKGFKTLFKKIPTMDSLIAIGTSSAFIYSLFATYNLYIGEKIYIDHLYYESTAVILALVMLGKYLENRSKKKTTDAIKKLVNLVPPVATVIRNNQTLEVDINTVVIDDICLVKPGSVVPVDGIIVEGFTYLDESHVTGESMPVKKEIGHKVIGGSINSQGFIKIKATAVGEDSTIHKMIKLVESANAKKAPIAKMADIISGYFVPVILVLAVVVSLLWLIAGYEFVFVFQIFITILVIACPCALGLATPVAIVTATGKGASNGILIKSGEALEIMHKAKAIVLDKTGTITEGKPVVTDMIIYNKNYSENQVMKMVASVENKSEHPLASAIINSYGQTDFFDVVDFTNIVGMGIKASINNSIVAIGNQKLMTETKIDLKNSLDDYEQLSNNAKTVLFISVDNELIGLIAITDPIRKTSFNAIKKLQKMGLQVVMLTGDNTKTASAIATQLGIKDVIAEVLPQDKHYHIEQLQLNHKYVVMVGDGINDAPALAQANVGVAMGTGTDIAIDSADIILMQGNLHLLVAAINLSRKTLSIIKQNLFWAFIYNVLGIPVAAGLLYLFGGPLLSPMIAGTAMAFSSLSVVLNALRLKKINLKSE